MQEYIAFIQENPILVGAFAALLALIIFTEIKKATQKFKNLNTQALVSLMNSVEPLLLDVRENNEVKAGKLKGAKHIPLGNLKTRLNELEQNKDQPIVVYCRSGNRSANAAGVLTKHGFEEVYNLKGGITAWESDNLPVSRK